MHGGHETGSCTLGYDDVSGPLNESEIIFFLNLGFLHCNVLYVTRTFQLQHIRPLYGKKQIVTI